MLSSKDKFIAAAKAVGKQAVDKKRKDGSLPAKHGFASVVEQAVDQDRQAKGLPAKYGVISAEERYEQDLAQTLAEREARMRVNFGNANPLHSVLGMNDIGPNIMGYLDTRSLGRLSQASKAANRLTDHPLNKSHADYVIYTEFGEDKEEAKQRFEEARSAVNIGFRLLTEYLGGQTDLDIKKIGVSDKMWTAFLTSIEKDKQRREFLATSPSEKEQKEYKRVHGKPMTPSAAAGYIVEGIATHILKKRSDEYNFQDNDVMGTATRPDVTRITDENKEQILMDITSDEGHILKKPKEGKEEETNWLNHPHVAEILYPSVDFSNPGNMNVKMATADAEAVFDRVINSVVDNETKRYRNTRKERTDYNQTKRRRIKELNSLIASGASDKKVQSYVTNMESEGMEVLMYEEESKKKYIASWPSYTNNPNKQYGLNPLLFAPPSPSHYSMSSDEKMPDESAFPTEEDYEKGAREKANSKYKRKREDGK